ncbi:Glutamate-gated chloride channel, partial [Stegodyphus mimosarum]
MTVWIQITVFLFLSTQLYFVRSETRQETEKRILHQIFQKYDPSIRPSGKNGTGPVIVKVNTFVRSINNIDDVKMEYETQLTFRQAWMDERLKYNDRGLNYVTVTRPEKLWIPDLFFRNEKSGHFHNIITPNNLLRIFPNGDVLYSTRISLKLFCPMDLQNYPLDQQICSISCASYGYTTEDLIFLWKEDNPIQMAQNVYLAKFNLHRYETDNCTSRTSTGEYSCLKLDFFFSRHFIYFLERAYLPTAALVFLSWITFWLNSRSTAVRLGIWVGVLVSLIIVNTSIIASMPQVSFTKAIDVWMGMCICFVFCVLIELCLVNNANASDEKVELPNLSADERKDAMLHNFTTVPLRWLNKYSTKGQRIDAISRFLFPAAFAFFNFVYWLKYTST